MKARLSDKQEICKKNRTFSGDLYSLICFLCIKCGFCNLENMFRTRKAIRKDMAVIIYKTCTNVTW